MDGALTADCTGQVHDVLARLAAGDVVRIAMLDLDRAGVRLAAEGVVFTSDLVTTLLRHLATELARVDPAGTVLVGSLDECYVFFSGRLDPPAVIEFLRETCDHLRYEVAGDRVLGTADPDRLERLNALGCRIQVLPDGRLRFCADGEGARQELDGLRGVRLLAPPDPSFTAGVVSSVGFAGGPLERLHRMVARASALVEEGKARGGAHTVAGSSADAGPRGRQAVLDPDAALGVWREFLAATASRPGTPEVDLGWANPLAGLLRPDDVIWQAVARLPDTVPIGLRFYFGGPLLRRVRAKVNGGIEAVPGGDGHVVGRRGYLNRLVGDHLFANLVMEWCGRVLVDELPDESRAASDEPLLLRPPMSLLLTSPWSDEAVQGFPDELLRYLTRVIERCDAGLPDTPIGLVNADLLPIHPRHLTWNPVLLGPSFAKRTGGTLIRRRDRIRISDLGGLNSQTLDDPALRAIVERDLAKGSTDRPDPRPPRARTVVLDDYWRTW